MPVIRKSPPEATPEVKRLVRGLVDELTTNTPDGPDILEEEQRDGSWHVRVIWDAWGPVADRSWVILEAYKLKCPELFPLIASAHGFTPREAEKLGVIPSRQGPVGPDELGEVIKRISCDLHTDDNAATADPLFCVYQKQRVYGLTSDYTDDFVWVITDGEGDEADSEEAAHLDKIGMEAAEALGWRRVGYREVDVFVTACLTREGAAGYIARNGHNLRRPFLFVAGLYRNEEMISLRKYLMMLRPVPDGSGSS